MRTNITVEDFSMADLDDLMLFNDNMYPSEPVIYVGPWLLNSPFMIEFERADPKVIRCGVYEFRVIDAFPPLHFHMTGVTDGPTHVNHFQKIAETRNFMRAILKKMSLFTCTTTKKGESRSILHRIEEDGMLTPIS